jgi:hypothetical protein
VGGRALRWAAAVAPFAAGLLAVAFIAGAPIAAQTAPAFDALSETQRRLLAGLATLPPPSTARTMTTRTWFDGADASFRDAFVTITGVLATVSLSDQENGEILGVALDLVDGIEPPARQPAAGSATGRVELAVRLAPGARDRLRRSSEFASANGSAAPNRPAAYRQKDSPALLVALEATGTRAIISVAR